MHTFQSGCNVRSIAHRRSASDIGIAMCMSGIIDQLEWPFPDVDPVGQLQRKISEAGY